jgi:hypothetical protein
MTQGKDRAHHGALLMIASYFPSDGGLILKDLKAIGIVDLRNGTADTGCQGDDRIIASGGE